MKKTIKLWHLIVSIVVTILATLLVTNLMEGEKRIESEVHHLYGVTDPQYLRSMSVLLGPPALEANSITHLENGERIFPAMLEAIRSARKTITFETYIYWSGDIGRRFAEALCERARAGVKVHVLLDWVGSAKMEQSLLDELKACSVQLERYHEPSFFNLTRLNNRTHRKLLVVDGRIGFTGGVGIADQWAGDAQDPEHWRDSHFRAEGPVAAQIQAVFVDNWTKATGKLLHGSDYFPKLQGAGKLAAQMFSSSPTGGSESMQLMYLLSIASARSTILIANSYFVPDDLAIDAMVLAVKRGVKIRVITPGEHIDTEVVRRASRARWGKLLEAGVEIYEFAPTMFHCKIMIVDGYMVSTGSTNFDNRSFRLNDEANLNVYDIGFAQEMTAVFERDVARSKRITLAQWENRPYLEKLMEHTLALFRQQL